MTCPRIYKQSLSECKKWALQNCHGFSSNEKTWLQPPSWSHRSSWLCHAGLFGILRKIYTATGHSCDSNTVTNLHSTLRKLTDTISTTQSLIHSINGKVVYLNTKLTSVISTLHDIDSTFNEWAQSLSNFSKIEQCHHNSLLEFMSHFSTSINRAFYAILRLNEIQDILNQITHLTQKVLIGYSHFPRFLATDISPRLDSDRSMTLTEKALKEGFPLLVNPLVNIEHTGRQLELSVLFTVPEISDLNSFCTVELLSPIKYNISGTCYTGPITYDDLALIACSNVKSLIKVDALSKCFQQDNTLLCPQHIFQPVKNIAWLGFPWNSASQMSFPRHHQPAHDCSNLHPLLHLGGRYYLATTTGTLQLNKGPLQISPPAVYHFPCNVTFNGIGICPDTMDVTVPLFNLDHIRFVPWQPSADNSVWKLHYQSLNITKPFKIDKTTLKQLDDTYKLLDSRFSQQLNTVHTIINNIHDAAISSVNDICTYVALTFTALNMMILMFLLRKLCRPLCFVFPSGSSAHSTRTQPTG